MPIGASGPEVVASRGELDAPTPRATPAQITAPPGISGATGSGRASRAAVWQGKPRHGAGWVDVEKEAEENKRCLEVTMTCLF